MPSQTMRALDHDRRLGDQLDDETHERLAWVYWVACLSGIALFSAAAPAGARLWTPAGAAFSGLYLAVGAAYTFRIAVIGRPGITERLLAGIVLTLFAGMQQWLVHPAPLLFVMLPALVLGAVLAHQGRERGLYLACAGAVALSPLLYAPLSREVVLAQLGLLVVLALESVMQLGYGDRLRRQRVALADAERAAHRRSLVDELTGLGNRRALEQRLAGDAPGSTTVVYCDLDGFKPFNDRFGHAAGDALLRRLGRAVRGVARGADAFRVGGDEFCVFVAGAHEPDDPAVLEITSALGEVTEDYVVSCSCGVAVVPRDASDLAGAIRIADARMYGCKSARAI